MKKYIIIALWLIFLLFFMFFAVKPYSTSNLTGMSVDIAKYQTDYEDYWKTHKDQIGKIFNAYINEFQYHACIDYTGLRERITGKVIDFPVINSNEKDIEIVYQLHKFVYNEINYSQIKENLSVDEILSMKKGDCSEKSLLLASLLKGRGFEYYIANGRNHRYVFVKIEDRWLPVDPMAEDLFYVYKIWNTDLKNDYIDEQPSLVNSDGTLFNKKWC